MQGNPQGTALEFVGKLNEVIIYPLIALLLGVALLVFVWGVFQFIAGAGDETKRAEGRRHMLWGVIGFVVMLSAVGILSLALSTFGIDPEEDIPGGLRSSTGS